MKAKFFTASSLLIATLTSATLLNSAQADTTSTQHQDNNQQVKQSQHQKKSNIQNKDNIKPIEKKKEQMLYYLTIIDTKLQIRL